MPDIIIRGNKIDFDATISNLDIIFNGWLKWFNTLTADYEITRRLRSLPRCQTTCRLRSLPDCQITSFLVLTHIKNLTCHFLASFLKIAAAGDVLNTLMSSLMKFTICLEAYGLV